MLHAHGAFGWLRFVRGSFFVSCRVAAAHVRPAVRSRLPTNSPTQLAPNTRTPLTERGRTQHHTRGAVSEGTRARPPPSRPPPRCRTHTATELALPTPGSSTTATRQLPRPRWRWRGPQLKSPASAHRPSTASDRSDPPRRHLQTPLRHHGLAATMLRADEEESDHQGEQSSTCMRDRSPAQLPAAPHPRIVCV